MTHKVDAVKIAELRARIAYSRTLYVGNGEGRGGAVKIGIGILEHIIDGYEMALKRGLITERKVV